MIMRKKVILAMMISGIFTVNFIFNATSVKATSNKLSEADIVEYTMNGNTELNILNEKIKMSEKKYDEALDEKYEEGATEIETEKRQEVYPYQAELELNNLKWNKEQKDNQLYLQGIRGYYNLLIEDKLIASQEYEIDKIKKEIEKIKKQIEAGVVAESSLTNYELSLENSQIKLQKLNNEKEKMIMELNLLMGKDVREELSLQEKEVPYKEYKVDDLDKVIDKLTKEDYRITKIEKETVIAIQEKNIMAQHNDSGQYDNSIKNAKDNLIELSYDTEDQKREIEYEVRTDYKNILKLQNEVLIKQIDYDNNLKLLETAEDRLRLGYITDLDIIKYKQDVASAEQELEKSKLEQYIAVQDFKDLTGDY